MSSTRWSQAGISRRLMFAINVIICLPEKPPGFIRGLFCVDREDGMDKDDGITVTVV
jgi:hypothetical protein